MAATSAFVPGRAAAIQDGITAGDSNGYCVSMTTRAMAELRCDDGVRGHAGILSDYAFG